LRSRKPGIAAEAAPTGGNGGQAKPTTVSWEIGAPEWRAFGIESRKIMALAEDTSVGAGHTPFMRQY